MKNIIYILIIALVAVATYYFFNHTGCNGQPKSIIIKEPKPYPVFINTVEIQDTGTTKRIYLPAKADSSALKALLGQMDSLREELKAAQVRSLFSMDTTTADSDRIHVDCDEISRSIALKIDFGKRTVFIPQEKEVFIQMEKPKWSIGVGGGGVFTLPDGQIKYGITANLQYNIFTF